MATLNVQLTNNNYSTLKLLECSHGVNGIAPFILSGKTVHFSKEWFPVPDANNQSFHYRGFDLDLTVAVVRDAGDTWNQLQTSTDGKCRLSPPVPDGWEHNIDESPQLPPNLTNKD